MSKKNPVVIPGLAALPMESKRLPQKAKSSVVIPNKGQVICTPSPATAASSSSSSSSTTAAPSKSDMEKDINDVNELMDALSEYSASAFKPALNDALQKYFDLTDAWIAAYRQATGKRQLAAEGSLTYLNDWSQDEPRPTYTELYNELVLFFTILVPDKVREVGSAIALSKSVEDAEKEDEDLPESLKSYDKDLTEFIVMVSEQPATTPQVQLELDAVLLWYDNWKGIMQRQKDSLKFNLDLKEREKLLSDIKEEFRTSLNNMSSTKLRERMKQFRVASFPKPE